MTTLEAFITTAAGKGHRLFARRHTNRGTIHYHHVSPDDYREAANPTKCLITRAIGAFGPLHFLLFHVNDTPEHRRAYERLRNTDLIWIKDHTAEFTSLPGNQCLSRTRDLQYVLVLANRDLQFVINATTHASEQLDGDNLSAGNTSNDEDLLSGQTSPQSEVLNVTIASHNEEPLRPPSVLRSLTPDEEARFLPHTEVRSPSPPGQEAFFAAIRNQVSARSFTSTMTSHVNLASLSLEQLQEEVRARQHLGIPENAVPSGSNRNLTHIPPASTSNSSSTRQPWQSIRLESRPDPEALLNPKVQQLGLLRARIENNRRAIIRDTAKSTSGLPAYLVSAPVITVPCTQLFSDKFYTDINELLGEASKNLSARIIREMHRITSDLEAEFQQILVDWAPTEAEEIAVEAVYRSRIDLNIRIQDRPTIENPAFLIKPDASKGHTLITPNPELRTLYKTAGRIPNQRKENGPANSRPQQHQRSSGQRQQHRSYNPRSWSNQQNRAVYPDQPDEGETDHEGREHGHQNRDFQQSRHFRGRR
jgi:hypothetical protein